VAEGGATVEERRLEAALSRLTAKLRRANRKWSLLPEGARVAVGVSGGSDSLVLVRLLVASNRTLRRPLELIAVHVPLTADGPAEPLPCRVRAWLSDLGVALEERAASLGPCDVPPLDCFRCARLRRRALLEGAQALGCPILALGHHADDVVETWLLSLLYTGASEVLAPHRSYFGGVVRVVRPLHEMRRQELRRLARLAGAPDTESSCSREASSRRARARALLGALGRDQRLVRRHLYWAAVRGLKETSGGAPTMLP
jgi:tRNA 2-thiocytidine biosynthesis protein TtcA